MYSGKRLCIGPLPYGHSNDGSSRYRVIDIDDRAERVYNFQKNTRFAIKELLEAAGLNHPRDLNRRHIVRRLSASQIKLAEQIYPKINYGALLRGEKT